MQLPKSCDGGTFGNLGMVYQKGCSNRKGGGVVGAIRPREWLLRALRDAFYKRAWTPPCVAVLPGPQEHYKSTAVLQQACLY